MNRLVRAGTWFGLVLGVAGLSVVATASAQDAGVRRGRAGRASADAGVAEAPVDAVVAPVVAEAAAPEVAPVEPAPPVEAEREIAPDPVPEPEPLPVVTAAPAPTPAASSAPAASPGPGVPAADASIPIRFELHGYYRARLVWTQNVPVVNPDPTPAGGADGAFAGFGFMRLRLDPAITYGTDPLNPIAALRFQIDSLDNVVFGDNARLMKTPLFTEGPSMTDIDGVDVQPFRLRRAWLEFLLPIGQLRIGRQGSQGGMGILFNDGNGFKTDWGDPQYGTTYDRLLFATRPLTIYNVIAHGDARPTPLILAIAHDWLVEDPVGLNAYGTYRDDYDGTTGTAVPGTLARSPLPFQNAINGVDDVEESVLVLAWNDPKVNPLRATDELSLGFIGVYRSQNVTSSSVYIGDLFWKTRLSPFGNRSLQLVLNGEVETIQGSSNGLGTIGGNFVDDPSGRPTGRTAVPVHANIWGAVAQAGVAMDKKWLAMAEWGYASGDSKVLSDVGGDFTQRPLHSDYHVGLLMYPVALAALTADTYTESARPLWSRGGVWNSMYLFPQGRYQIMNGVEVLGAFLLAWADTLNDAYPNAADARLTAHPGAADPGQCSAFEPACFLGWEADVALKVTWGENDILRWSTEFGVMGAGGALAQELHNDLLYTLQTRIAMVF